MNTLYFIVDKSWNKNEKEEYTPLDFVAENTILAECIRLDLEAKYVTRGRNRSLTQVADKLRQNIDP